MKQIQIYRKNSTEDDSIAIITPMRRLLLALLIVAGLFILWPYHNFQEHLSPGDHGRDLYAGQAALRGEAPYQDFWWVYGPLMPYINGLCYKLLGVHITSLIIQKLFFKLLAAIFLYLGLAVFITPLAAFLAGIWFLLFHPDFFFTYNHIAGIAMVLGVCWALCHFLRNGALRWIYTALFFAFILGLIKINFSLTALIMIAGSILSYDIIYQQKLTAHKKSLYLLTLLGVPLLLLTIYSSCLKGLSIMEIRQCLPYFHEDQPYNITILQALSIFASVTWKNLTAGWVSISFAVLLNISIWRTAYIILRHQATKTEIKALLTLLIFLCAFYLINFHEFLKSGVWYRSYWSQPFSIALCFVLIDFATRQSHGLFRKCALSLIAVIALLAGITAAERLSTLKVSPQAFNVDGRTVYLTSQPEWINTVTQTTQFLNAALKPDELFFALPYDGLYYYLTGKPSPTRQLIFFDHIKISPEQEKSIIKELEENKTSYCLVSSRAYARLEYGLGILGQTYCPLIARYINDNFIPVARLGDWTNEPGWAWNHGTLILKRK